MKAYAVNIIKMCVPKSYKIMITLLEDDITIWVPIQLEVKKMYTWTYKLSMCGTFLCIIPK